MKRLMVAGALGLALACLPVLAQAAPAFVTRSANLRAGPDTGYPVVAALQPGVQVELFGCIQGWSWCDVAVSGYRGWIYGAYLQSAYQTQQVPVINYGSQLGIPLVVFSFGSYWDNYYRGQSWYGDRQRYEHYQPRYLGRGPGPVYRQPSYNQPSRGGYNNNQPRPYNPPRNQGNGNPQHNNNPPRNNPQPGGQRPPQQQFHNNPGGGKPQPGVVHGAQPSHARGQPGQGPR